MHVIFVEPAFPANQREFVRGLHRAGAFVTGIGERPAEYLDDEMKGWLGGYEQVRSVVHEPSMLEAVRRIQKRGWVDRLEATVEAHVMAAAHVREQCGIPGTTVRTAHLCRDKPAMKEALRQTGVPCAQSDGVDSVEALQAFATRVGFPLIVKPRDGAGASGTFKVTNDDELLNAANESGLAQGRSVAVEEFIEGHEAFYDTITVGGRVVHDFVTHYYPGVLEAMRTRWISPVFIATNRVDADSYEAVRELGRNVIAGLGIDTSPTHMEWFYGSKGLKFSEIGCRPPGVGAWDLYAAGNEFDIYCEWARAIMGKPPAERPSRRFSAALINLRPDRDGKITHYDGIEELQRRFGDLIIDSRLPTPGTPTMGVESGYMANAWIRLRHPDYDQLREILDWIGENVHVHAR